MIEPGSLRRASRRSASAGRVGRVGWPLAAVALLTLPGVLGGCGAAIGSTALRSPSPSATAAPTYPPTTEGRLTQRVALALGRAAKDVNVTYQPGDGTVVALVTLVWTPRWTMDWMAAQSAAKSACFQSQAVLWTSGVPLTKVTVTVLGQALDDYSSVITSAYAAAVLTATNARAIQWSTTNANEAWTRYDYTFLRPTYHPDWIYPPPSTPTP